MHSLEVTPEVYTQSYGIALWCSLLSTITPKLPGSLGPLIPVPSQKSGALVSQLCYALLMTTSVSGTRQWEDKERRQQQEFAQALVFTCLLIEDFLSLRILGIYLLMLPSPLPLLLLQDWWDWHRWDRKKKKETGKTSFSLWFLGVPFLVFRPERKLYLLSWSSFCIYVVHASRFQAAFESRPANTGGKKWETQRNSVVLQILVSFSDLLTTIYFSMVHKFCPGIINAFRGDKADCVYSIFPRTNLSSIRLPFQLLVISRNSMWFFFRIIWSVLILSHFFVIRSIISLIILNKPHIIILHSITDNFNIFSQCCCWSDSAMLFSADSHFM